MMLGGELFRAEAVGGHNFDGEWAGTDKPTGIEDNLCYHGVIWHHHSNWAEESLEVIREFRTTWKMSLS